MGEHDMAEGGRVHADNAPLASVRAAGSDGRRSARAAREPAAREPFERALDAYQLRCLVEPIVVGLAARRVGDRELAVLGEWAPVGGGADEDVDVETALGRNREFHVAVARASGNARLARVIADLIDDMAPLLEAELATARTRGEWDAEHAELLEALSAGDAAHAAAVSRASFIADAGFLPRRARKELRHALQGPVGEGLRKDRA